MNASTTPLTDLLSLVLTLRPLAPTFGPSPVANSGDSGGGQWLGRAAHAVVLDAVRQSDPVLAEELHSGSGLRPFTASGLIGASRHRQLSPERTYTLRLTTLTAPVTRTLISAAQSGGPLALGTAIRLDDTLFKVESLSPGLDAADEAESYEHPWAARTTYETLSAPWLLGRAHPGSRITLQFTSPTTFKSGGLHVPVPLPSLVFGGLLERWNAFAPVALPPEARRFAEECLALTAYRLSTRMIPVKEGGLRAGAVGEARYTAVNHDRYWLSVMNLLADFALFAGVGAGTGMGLGQCRRVPDRESGRTEAANG